MSTNPLMYSVFETPDDKWSEIAESMKAFVPSVSLSVIQKKLKESNKKELEPFVEDVNIVHLWIDISGFTVLAEKLHQLYSRAEGEEKLTNILNEYFTKMNSIIEKHEGCIFKIAGDAVSVVWNYQGNNRGENSLYNFLSALDCAIEIQRNLDNYHSNSMNGVFLSCKIAIGVGIAQFLLVGDGNPYETVLYGDPLRQTTLASEECVAGDIILSDKSLNLVRSSLPASYLKFFGELSACGSRLNYEQLDDSFRFSSVQSEDLFHDTEESPQKENLLMKSRFEVEEKERRDAQKFVKRMEKLVPEIVTKKVSHSSEGYHSELRQVSVVFMLLNGIVLHETVQSVQTIHEPLQKSRWHQEFRESSEFLLGHSFNELRHSHKRESQNEALLNNIQKIFSGIQKRVLEGGGMIRQFILDDKGPVCIAVFGIHAYGDDPQRSVLASLQIDQFLKENKVEHSIGITTGRAFCGWVGTSNRREFGIVGDMVNLSARLMGAAKTLHESILVDEDTFENCKSTIAFKPLEAIRVKGKAEPVNIFLPLKPEVAAKIQAKGPIFGRESELRSICDLIEEYAYQGDKNVTIVVEGEKGIGKSHLLKEIKQKARQIRQQWKEDTGKEDHVVILSGYTSSLQQQTPLYAFRPILRHFLQKFYPSVFQFLQLCFPVLSEGSDEEVTTSERSDEEQDDRQVPLNQSCLQELILEDYGEKVSQSLNILKRILTDQRNANSYSENYAIDTRLSQLIKVLTDILHHFCHDGRRIVMTIEDVHWMDQTSWKMVKRLNLDVPLLLVLTSRPNSSRDLSVLKESDDCHTFSLRGMQQEEMCEMLNRRFELYKIPDSISSFVWQRTSGNPLFSIELFRMMIESETVIIEEEEQEGGNSLKSCKKKTMESLESVELPFTLESAIISRIDNLPLELLETLKAASVIGFSFTEEMLNAIQHPVEVKERLEKLVRHGFLESPSPQLEGSPHMRENEEYSFVHITTQEVVYRLITFSQKRNLHRLIALRLEAGGGSHVAHNYALMAHHWKCAGEVQKAIDYYEEAGEQAFNLFSEEGIAIYTHLVNCLLSPDYKEEDQLVRSYKIASACVRLVESSFQASLYASCYHYIIIGLEACGVKVPEGFQHLEDKPGEWLSRKQRIRLILEIIARVYVPGFFKRYSIHSKEGRLYLERTKLFYLISFGSSVNAKDPSISVLYSALNSLHLIEAEEEKAVHIENMAILTLARGHVGLGKWMESWYRKMRPEGTPISGQVFHFRLLSLERDGQWEEALDLVDSYHQHTMLIGDRHGVDVSLVCKSVIALVHSFDYNKVMSFTQDSISHDVNTPSVVRSCMWLWAVSAMDIKLPHKVQKVVEHLEKSAHSDILLEYLYINSTLGMIYQKRGDFNRALDHLHRIHQSIQHLSQNVVIPSIIIFCSFYLETLYDLAEEILIPENYNYFDSNPTNLDQKTIEELLDRLRIWSDEMLEYFRQVSKSLLIARPPYYLFQARSLRIFFGCEVRAVQNLNKAISQSRKYHMKYWEAHSCLHYLKSPYVSKELRLEHLFVAHQLFSKSGRRGIVEYLKRMQVKIDAEPQITLLDAIKPSFATAKCEKGKKFQRTMRATCKSYSFPFNRREFFLFCIVVVALMSFCVWIVPNFQSVRVLQRI